MKDIPYTRSEVEELNYTVGEAVKAASVRLKGTPMCVNALGGASMSEKISLRTLNRLSDALVDASLFYGGHWLPQ